MKRWLAIGLRLLAEKLDPGGPTHVVTHVQTDTSALARRISVELARQHPRLDTGRRERRG